MARVLLIHDGDGEGPDGSLWLRLERRGHLVRLARADAIKAYGSHFFDVVLLCCTKPHTRVPELIARLRQDDPRVGIIKLAEKPDAQWRIDSMLAGADFCEPATVRIEVLCACIDNILRRIVPLSWRLDVNARTLQAPDHDQLDINDRELVLLKLLADSNHHAVARADIALAFAGDKRALDDRVLEKMVSRLRRKWRDGTTHDLPLKTLHGVGYRFMENIKVC